MRCPHCGEEHPAGRVTCPNTGKPIGQQVKKKDRTGLIIAGVIAVFLLCICIAVGGFFAVRQLDLDLPFIDSQGPAVTGQDRDRNANDNNSTQANDTANDAANDVAQTENEVQAEEIVEEPDTGHVQGELSGTIVIWHSLNDGRTLGLQNALDDFAALHPEVDFEVQFVSYGDLRNQYEAAVMAGGGPDLLIGVGDWGPVMYDLGLIANVSDVPVFNVSEIAMGIGDYDGAQFGLPLELQGVVMYRNQRIISQPARDFADLRQKAEAATVGNTYGALLETGFFFSVGHLYGLGGELMTSEGDPAFNTAEGVAWLEMLGEFVEMGADMPYLDTDVNLFKAGSVGVIIDGSWNMDNLYEELGNDLVVDPWPADMSGFVQATMLYLNPNSKDEAQTASKALMTYLLGEEAQMVLTESYANFIPSNTAVEPPDLLRTQVMKAFEGGVGFIVIPEIGAYWGPMDTALREYLVNGTSAQDALDQAEIEVYENLEDIRGQNTAGEIYCALLWRRLFIDS